MGSASDWETLRHACETLDALGVPHERRVLSAHRMPEEMAAYARAAEERGLRVIMAGAGGAAHLPGMVAAHTLLPVLGVPVESAALRGLDSLLSIVQMPAGIPVATLAIGRAGAINAALLAVSMLATGDAALRERWAAYREAQTERARQRRAAVMAAPILPGARIGVLGSGQLGRMFAIAARRMGYRVHVLSPDDDTPTGQVADRGDRRRLRRPRPRARVRARRRRGDLRVRERPARDRRGSRRVRTGAARPATCCTRRSTGDARSAFSQRTAFRWRRMR